MAVALATVAFAVVIPITTAVAARDAAATPVRCEPHTCAIDLTTPGITLTSVSCPSSVRCVAVGYVSTPTSFLPVSATETDGVWRTEVLGQTSAPATKFLSVSCPSIASCVAVGWNASTDLPYFNGIAIGLDTSGTWSVVEGDASYVWEGLSSVSCHVASNCTAIGAETEDGSPVTAPVYETSAHGFWPGPSLFTPETQVDAPLSAISCATSSQCTAVGQHANGQPMVAADTNGSWLASTVEIPGATSDGTLTAVSCPSATSCTAVGYTEPDSSNLALGNEPIYATEVDGRWSAATVLTVSNGTASFNSVSCTSPEDCTAVGESRIDTSPTQPMYAVETGGVWSAPRAIVLPGLGGAFTSVACASAKVCTAVGDDGSGTAIYPTESAGKWPSVPGSPRRVHVTAGSTTLKVSWTEPATNGGSRITETTAVASVGALTFSCSTTATSCTIRGLANRTTYAVTVTSRNAAGQSAASTATSATPRA